MDTPDIHDEPTYVPTGDEWSSPRRARARHIANQAQHEYRMRRADSAIRFRDHGRTELP